MAEIFLSYSRHNQEIMRRLREDLRRANFSVWTDQTGLERGSPRWQSTIQETIEQSRCLVVLLSPQAKQSDWVKMEVSYAQAFHLRVFPVLVHGTKQTVVPITLINTDWFDARRRYSRALAELVAALRKHLGKATDKSALPTTSSPETRRQKVAEIVEAMGSPLASGSGVVGRIHLSYGLNAYGQDRSSYRAAIAPVTDPDVVEVSRRLELRGWHIAERFPSIFGGSLGRGPVSTRAYVYTWPGGTLDDQELRANVAEEIIAANELLGLWPEDVEVNIQIGPGI